MEQNPPKIISKRPVGRPKGSKNKPGAGTKGNPVGRLRKNRAATAHAAACTGGPGPARIHLDTVPPGSFCPALPEASPANPVVTDAPTITAITSAGHRASSPTLSDAEKDDEPWERLLTMQGTQSGTHEQPFNGLLARDTMHQTELTAFFTRKTKASDNGKGPILTSDDALGIARPQPESDEQLIPLKNQDHGPMGHIANSNMEIEPASCSTPSPVLNAILEGTTTPLHTPLPSVNAPPGAAQSPMIILKSPPPVAVCRAAENAVDEPVLLKPLVEATSNPPAALAETTTPAHESPPGLDAFDSDDDQDSYESDLGEILGSTLAEDLHPVNDLMAAPDDDENPADIPSSGGNSLETSRQPETPAPRSSIPHWLIDNYRDLCERLRTEMKQNASRQPSAYDAGQFLMAPKSPMFAAAHTNHLSPRLFYEPHYFLWLPHLFNRIPCPACKTAQRKNDNGSPIMLRLLGWPQAPRRVVDIDLTLYIVGYRYYCGQTDCWKTYQSWSPAIMDVLPPVVAAQFPFCLTYRCGVTDRLIALLRSSFQYGHGPRPFAEMIKSFHIRRYEQLMLQYYELVRMRKDSTLSGLLPKHLRFGAWDDRAGYAGYVPSGRYFGALYNLVIEKHAKEIDQRMAMLSCRILTIDHSFKVPKHLGKVNGEAVFGALHTGINEYVEVRTMTLTPTKAHSQFMPALATIPHSLRDYGHGDVELVFTDNVRADKNELERVFPSLLQNVEPVPISTTMECLQVPAEWRTTILESSYQILTRLNILLQSLETLPADQFIDIAMDMEWSVNRAEGIQGRIALVAIAFLPCIYLIRLSKFISQNGLLNPPAPLLVLLRSPRIHKFGVHVKQDMTRLFSDCGFSSHDIPFTGAVELGALAQQCHFTSRANTGLVDLVNTVLHHYLPKDESIRVSTAWDDESLSQAQIGYAALNVYASWALRNALLTLPACEKVTHKTAAGTPVKLLSCDRLVTVAVGFIAAGRGVEFNGVNVTKTRVIVNITSVLQPAYLIRAELLKSHLEVPIGSLAVSHPFSLLCHTKDLEITTIASLQHHNEALDLRTPLLPHPYESNYDPYSSPNGVLMQTSSHVGDEPSADLDWCASLSYDAEAEQSISESTPDPAAALLVQSLSGTESTSVSDSTELVQSAPPLLLYEDSEIRTRVLGDIWHLMNQFKIPATHGLRRPFARALRDALFVPDQADKVALEEVLCKTSITWEQMVLWKPHWVWKRVKRFVPCASMLYPRVAEVFCTFGPLKDATTNQPLFNKASFDTAKNILENVCLGHYSDPVGIKLYMAVGEDRNRLSVYRCLRGTNGIEGGIHMNIVKRFGSYNASPRFAVNLLRDYCLCHNLKVGTFNRTGKSYQGSFDIWVRNQISKLIDLTRDLFINPNEASGVSWVNGADYQQSRETFGILPLPHASQITLGMLQYSDEYATGEKIRHANLAKQQQTHVAILPVHTPAERALFRLLVSMPNGPFSGQSQPNWVAMASRWAQHCDGKTIFYKLPEHIKNYYKTWKEFRNEKNSLEQHRAAYEHVCNLVKPNPAAVPRVPVADRMTLEEQLIKPRGQDSHAHAATSDDAPTGWEISSLLGSQSSKVMATVFKYFDPSRTSTTTTNDQSQSQSSKGKKRAHSPAHDDGETQSSKRHRAPRTCVKCRRIDCPGRWKSEKCTAYSGQA